MANFDGFGTKTFWVGIPFCLRPILGMLRPIPGRTEWKWQLSLSVSPFFHCLLPLLALSSSKDCGPPSSPCLTSQRDISFQDVAQLYLIFLSSKNLAHIPAFIVTNIHGENGEDKEEDKENGEQVGHNVERDLSSSSKDCGPPSPFLTSQREISFQVVGPLVLHFSLSSSKNLAHILALIVANIPYNNIPKECDRKINDFYFP